MPSNHTEKPRTYLNIQGIARRPLRHLNQQPLHSIKQQTAVSTKPPFNSHAVKQSPLEEGDRTVHPFVRTDVISFITTRRVRADSRDVAARGEGVMHGLQIGIG